MNTDEEIILNFHGVGDIPVHVGSDEAPYWLEIDFFRQVLDLIDQHALCKKIRITFDDGNASDVEVCVPMIKEHSRSADFFVLGCRLNRRGYLSKEDLRTLLEEGMGIGSHGSNHVDWRTLDDERLHHELFAARDILETACGREIRKVAIPFGAYDGRVMRSIKSAGYQHIYTSDGGTAQIAKRVKPRTSLRRDMSLEDVERILQQREPLAKQARRVVSMFLRQHL